MGEVEFKQPIQASRILLHNTSIHKGGGLNQLFQANFLNSKNTL